jgi:hypothetical protein
MKIDRVKDGYMLYKTIDGKTHQLFITVEEASEIAAKYEADFEV